MKSREWAREQGRGVPVPGTGVTHGHRRSGSRNPAGGLFGNKEWGNKARKHEAEDRNLNNRARRNTIAEQVADLNSEAGRVRDDEMDYDVLEEVLEVGLPDGVTFNGHSYEPHDYDDPYDTHYTGRVG